MYTLEVAKAILIVRKNLDEQNINFSAMMPDENDLIAGEDTDSENLDDLIAKTLPEAINRIHMTAPIFMVDGIEPDEDKVEAEAKGDTLKVTIKDEMLRFISFKAKESDIIITEPVAEDSAIARMQHNPYTRAYYDRPCLVRLQNKASDLSTSFMYYGLKDSADGLGRIEYIPAYHYDPDTTEYRIAEMLHDMVMNQLTGMVLMTLGSNEIAQYYLAMSSFGNDETK